MDEHAKELLEFGKVIEELAGLSVSPPGAELLHAQPILTERAALDDLLGLCLEFRTILESGRQVPGFHFPELGPVLSLLGKQGGQLEGEDLAVIGRWVLSALKLKRAVLAPGENGRLAGIASAIPDLVALSRQIFRIVDHEGLLREKQIPELNAIRERIRRHREDADRAVRGLLEDRTSRTYWQTTTPTQRDGRVVLPLKSQFKGRVPGIVHEMSASGSTIFIEPLEVVEKNNAIVQEENLYRLEARRILRELTSAVSARKAELSLMVEKVAFLDTVMARARYAIQHSCRRAETPRGSDRSMNLRDARHPLLGSRVVPVSVAAGPDHRVLIITGPNTGGKTVSLKTVGLLALMNQFGMEIPATEGSILPLFDGVFADIGDEQSIEQSLSTFSAHVKNLSLIVRSATPHSLVLLDELGAGTDPQEGVALAMSLLDHFLAAGCIVLATTHHGILKNYGATRPGAQNASMGFDSATLAPTYRILMGVPGESHALEIARRSGMPANVLTDAFAYLDDERTDISRLVSNLAERHQKLIQAEEQHKTLEDELREKRRTTDLKELALREKELELRRIGLKELRDFLVDSRRELERIREKAGAQSAEDFKRFVSGVQSRVEAEELRIEQEREWLTPEPSFEVREGMEVVIARTGRRGRVLRKDKAGRWVVETETLRLALAPGELRPAPESTGSVAPVSYSQSSTIDPPVFELHLIGVRAEEALRQVEKQIDSALVHGLKEFSIVHGKGEGILRTAIHEYLRGLPVIQDFRFSSPEEGGFGKTIVTLKG
jgi:DNA mismatch repair protein MutS2